MSTNSKPGRMILSEDLLRINVIADARISPDGTRIAYTIQVADLDQNRYRSAVWMANTRSGESRQFTAGNGQDSQPRWSPNGSQLAFVSDRSGTNQIHLIDAEGGEARQVTDLSRGATEPVWSPDGTKIAFLSSEGYGVDDEERNRPGGMIRHVTRKRYRFDVIGYIDDRFPQIWIVDVLTGVHQQVTAGLNPVASPNWAPDGWRIAFVANRQSESSLLFESQLHVISVPGFDTAIGEQDDAQQIDTGAEMHMMPAWSPDGSAIAFIGRRSGARAGANNDIYIVPADGSDRGQRLTSKFDRGVGLGNYSDTWDNSSPTLYWTVDGSAVRFSANDKGRVGLFEVKPGSDVRQIVGGDRSATAFSESEDGSCLAYHASSFTNPCDLFVFDGNGQNERQLTDINRKVLDEILIQHPAHMPFRSFDDRFDIDAWLIRPADFDPTKRYPLVQIIHGGPHSIFGHAFFFDMQQWASRGWNVLFINPRASQGYGEDFATACLADWGGADWKEQEQALDLAIEQGGVDPDRLAVTGLSYGGFMTNWIVGQTDRYRVAVSENSICNLISFMFTSDIGWAWLEREMERDVWSNLDWYMERSPITYLPNVKTPVLLLQSETDWRCPVEQGEQFYQGLRHCGIDSEMVRFPGESHGVLRNGKPQSRLVRREHTLRWFEKYL